MLLLTTLNETLAHHHQQQRCKSKGGTTWEEERDQWRGVGKTRERELDVSMIKIQYTRIKMS